MKGYLKTFLVGGSLCALAQAVLEIFLALGVDFAMSITLMLAVMALLGTVFTVLGIYGKLEEHGQMGAMVPFTGFSAAITTFNLLALKDGKKPGKAFYCGLRAALIIFGIGLPFALAMAIVGKLI